MNSFSIIVPVYNVEKYLNKCLESLVNQTYKDYEIIIVNDGSTDKSQNIINNYKEKYSKIVKSYKKKNGGLSSARNYGLKKATKDYILFVDSDDYIEKNTLEILNKNILNNEDIIIFNYNAIYENHIDKIDTFISNIKDLKKRYIISKPSACNKLFKKDFILNNNIKFIEGIYYEDLATIPSLIKYTNNIKFISDYLYNYVVRNESILNKKTYNKKMDDIFYACENNKKILLDDYKEEVEYIYIDHLLRNASLRFLNYNKYDKIDNVREIIKKFFPKWRKNIYYKNYYSLKQKIMCNIIMYKLYFIIKK